MKEGRERSESMSGETVAEKMKDHGQRHLGSLYRLEKVT